MKQETNGGPMPARMQTADDAAIGRYVGALIKKKYEKDRDFCRAYLAAVGRPGPDEEQNMANRLAQIKNGKKGIQIRDLPVFSWLLHVSCEQILTAGRCFAPQRRLTNYQVAQSKDQNLWKAYLERDDQIIMNLDEYNKSVVDYALDCGNYPFLRYLMQEGIIWFVNTDEKDYLLSFGAGCSIPKKPAILRETLPAYMYEAGDALRRRMIGLAIQNRDIPMLKNLHAREIPPMYWLFPRGQMWEPVCYQDAELEQAIAEADGTILDYFSQEFDVKGAIRSVCPFTYPYLGAVLDRMIDAGHEASKTLLKRCLDHNKRVCQALKQVQNTTYEEIKKNQNKPWITEEMAIDFAEHEVQRWLDSEQELREDGSLLYIRKYSGGANVYSNLIAITANSKDFILQDLIRDVNEANRQAMALREWHGPYAVEETP